jgi:hypothetical protein
MRGRGSLIGVCALAALVAGCGSSSSDKSSSSTQSASTTKQAAAPKPTIKFVTPKNGSTATGSVKATVALSNFKIAPQAVGQAPRPGEGHLHFKMDEGKYDFPKYSGKNGLIAKQLGVTGHYSPALAPEITYRNLPPGKHVLEVYLANNNHTNVGVEAKVAFRLR